MDDSFIPGMVIGVVVTLFVSIIAYRSEYLNNYYDGYCEAIKSIYIEDMGCVLDDKIIYKVNK